MKPASRKSKKNTKQVQPSVLHIAPPAKSSSNPIHNLVIISDTHCGSRVGLCPPGGIQLDGSGNYNTDTSLTQKWLWKHWEIFWNQWVPTVTKGEPYAVVHNGDAIDGMPHGSIEQVSHNMMEQREIAYQALAPVVDLCDGRFYLVRGTEAHVGKSGNDEESLAKRLGTVKNESGQSSRWEMWKMCGKGLIHFAHHIGTTQSMNYESSAVMAELTKMLLEASRWQHRSPDIVVRSHRHSYCEVVVGAHREEWGVSAANRHRIRSLVTPSWQGTTPFAYKVARGKPPQIGGVLIRWSPNDEVLYSEAYLATLRDIEITL